MNVRVNANDKKNFEQFCNSVGLNVSTAVNMFIKAVLREQKLPFEIKTGNYDEIITKRYTIEEVKSSMNSIINKD